MKVSKTAVSLPSHLLTRTNQLAQKTGNSRSGIIAIALEEYLAKQEQQTILERLNRVYGDESLNNEDRDFLEAAVGYMAKNVISNED